jgi:hypothetical protein
MQKDYRKIQFTSHYSFDSFEMFLIHKDINYFLCEDSIWVEVTESYDLVAIANEYSEYCESAVICGNIF